MARLLELPTDSAVVDIVVVDAAAAHEPLWQDARLNAECCLCSTGHEALRLPPAAGVLWLVNTRLPDMAGLELWHLLRSRWRDKYVVLVADQHDPAQELAALQTGRLHYACKPLTTAWLQRVWRSVLGRQAPISTPALNEMTPAAATYDSGTSPAL